MLIDPRNGPDFDLPLPRTLGAPGELPAPRCWVLASTPRSGSTLLCRTLWESGGVGAPKEYLNPVQVRDWLLRSSQNPVARLRYRLMRGPALALALRGSWDEERLRRHLDLLRARRSGPGGWFGIKLHYHHYEHWFVRQGFSLEAQLAPERWVLLCRADRVAQAVSWARAQQTGRWASHQRGWLPPRYHRGLIAARLRDIERAEAGWQRYFDANGIEPLRLHYEDVVRDLESAARAVLAHVAGASAAERSIVVPEVKAQADPENARWVERFRAESSR